MKLLNCAIVLCCLQLTVVVDSARALNIATNPVNGAQRAAIYHQIKAFERKHPNIKVNIHVYEHEMYKKRLEDWLTAGSNHDVFFWFGGNRLRYFARNGLVADLSQIWQTHNFDQRFPKAARENIEINGAPHALPLYYYQWGIYFRQSLFNQYNLKTPSNWEEFLTLARALKAQGITPFTIGNKNHWPAAGWFDYLNLRVNGATFHLALLNGEISFKHPGVREVFVLWSGLIKEGFFIEGNENYDWKGALPLLYHNRAGMILMGNFFLSEVPERLKEGFDFFPFPRIKSDVPLAEDAPMDVLVVAKGKESQKDISLFLEHMASKDVQAALAGSMNMIPINQHASLVPDPVIARGANMLSRADALAQFFDRDSRPEFSKRAMAIFAKFMNGEKGIDQAIDQLEALRIKYLSD